MCNFTSLHTGPKTIFFWAPSFKWVSHQYCTCVYMYMLKCVWFVNSKWDHICCDWMATRLKKLHVHVALAGHYVCGRSFTCTCTYICNTEFTCTHTSLFVVCTCTCIYMYIYRGWLLLGLRMSPGRQRN